MKKFLLVSALCSLLAASAHATYKARVVFNKLEKIEVIANKYYLSGSIEVNGSRWSSNSSTLVMSPSKDCMTLANTAFIKDATFSINVEALVSSKGLDIEVVNVFACSVK